MASLTWQLSAAKGLLSRLIIWFGGGEFSHVDLVMPNGNLAGARSDKVGGGSGYRERPSDYFPFVKRVRFTLEVTPEQELAVYAASNAKVGANYNRATIFGLIFGWNLTQPGTWDCSEAQIDNCQQAKIIPPEYISNNKITPNDFALILTAIGAKAQVAT